MVFWSSIFLVASALVCSAEEPGLRGHATIRMLRDMSNQTNADSLNLPANSTSIRANITDTFSCQNRTYGYYADVDNECQIFHVCQPSRTTSGRNVTYKWSFICPNETVFNQEVLVCTRPRESIPCEESPMYYDVNSEFGKVNRTEGQNSNQSYAQTNDTTKRLMNRSRIKYNQKQNLVEKVEKHVLNSLSGDLQAMEETSNVKINDNKEIPIEVKDVEPAVADVSETESYQGPIKDDVSVEINERMGGERSIKHKDKRARRFGFRFKADVV